MGTLRLAALVPGIGFLVVTGYLALMAAVMPAMNPPPQHSLEALRRLPPSELADAFAAAQDTFRQNTLDAEGVFQLSRFAEARGDRDAAQRLKLIAGDLQPRALRIQAEALAILIARRDFERAMTRLDGLIRARPNKSRILFAVAADIAADPDGRGAVAGRLAQRPPWRKHFIADAVSSGNAQVAQQIMSDLRSMGTAPDTTEVALLIGHYLKAGEIDAAYAAWLSSLTPEELSRVRLVYDGGFDGEIRSLAFDWTIKPVKGLSHRLFPRNTASMDMMLQLDFLDFRQDFANLSQILRLRPGRYRLRGEVRLEAIQPPTEFLFRIHCLENGSRSPLEETSSLPQSSQWIAFEKNFTVPPDGCRNQVLGLEGRKGPSTARISRGQLSLDSIAIESLAALAP